MQGGEEGGQTFHRNDLVVVDLHARQSLQMHLRLPIKMNIEFLRAQHGFSVIRERFRGCESHVLVDGDVCLSLGFGVGDVDVGKGLLAIEGESSAEAIDLGVVLAVAADNTRKLEVDAVGFRVGDFLRGDFESGLVDFLLCALGNRDEDDGKDDD